MGKFETVESVKGYIRYWGLAEWWISEFTQEERIYMNDKYQTLPNMSITIGGSDTEDTVEYDEETECFWVIDKETGQRREFDEEKDEFPGWKKGLLAEEDMMSREENESYISTHVIQYNPKTQHPSLFLGGLSGYFNTIKDGSIALRLADKSIEMLDNSIPLMDLHFLFNPIIDVYYRNRHIPESLEKFILISEKSIGIAPQLKKPWKERFPYDKNLPYHHIYTQFVIFKEKEKKYQEAIDICTKAMNEGWQGDWEKRIERCKKKLNKLNC